MCRIWSFHVVVLHRMANECTEIYNTGEQSKLSTTLSMERSVNLKLNMNIVKIGDKTFDPALSKSKAGFLRSAYIL